MGLFTDLGLDPFDPPFSNKARDFIRKKILGFDPDKERKKQEALARAQRNKGEEIRFTNANQPLNICYGYTAINGLTSWADNKDTINFAPDLYGDRVFNGFAKVDNGPRLIGGNRNVTEKDGKHAFLITQDSICAAPISRVTAITVDGSPNEDKKFGGYMQISANPFGGRPHPVAIANDVTDPERTSRVTAKATGLAYATNLYQKNRDEPQFSGAPKIRYFMQGRRVKGLLHKGSPIAGNALSSINNTPLEPQAIVDIAAEEAARIEAERIAALPNYGRPPTPRTARQRCSSAGGRWTGNTRDTRNNSADSYRGIRGCRRRSSGGGGGGGGTCVPGDTFIQMATGDWKRIDEVLVGEKIQGRTQINTVLAYDRLFLKDHATPVLYEINKAYQNTDDHLTLLDTGWAVFNKCNYREYNGQVLDCVYDENLNPTPMLFKGFPEEEIREYSVGSNIAIGSSGSYTNINSIEAVRADDEQTIYSLVADGDGTMIVQGGYVLSAWADSDKWRGE